MSATLMTHEAPLKILAVDDHPLTREALGQVLAQVAPRVEMLEADTLAAACARLAADPDIRLVVLDPGLPDTGGVDTVRSIMEASPKALVVVLANRDDPSTARAALEIGAHGFISRRAPTRVLVEALRLVLAAASTSRRKRCARSLPRSGPVRPRQRTRRRRPPHRRSPSV